MLFLYFQEKDDIGVHLATDKAGQLLESLEELTENGKISLLMDMDSFQNSKGESMSMTHW